MGTVLDPSRINMNHVIVWDLEFIGDIRKSVADCYIYNIAAINLMTGYTFDVFVLPDREPYPPPANAQLPIITPRALKRKGAVSFKKGFSQFMQWCPDQAILVSHNNFRSDKPLLQLECARHGLSVPLEWYFADSLIYLRQTIPRLGSYTLNSVYSHLFEMDIPHLHEGLADCVALRRIIVHLGIVNLKTSMYPAYSTPLQCVKGVGVSSELVIFDSNIRSVEELVVALHRGYTTGRLYRQISFLQFITETLVRFGFMSHQAKKLTPHVKSWVDKYLSKSIYI